MALLGNGAASGSRLLKAPNPTSARLCPFDYRSLAIGNLVSCVMAKTKPRRSGDPAGWMRESRTGVLGWPDPNESVARWT
jgi:hypothetical protein